MAKYNRAMLRRLSILLRVLIPLLLLVSLDIWPTSRMAGHLLAEARTEVKAGRQEKIVGLLTKIAGLQPYRRLEEKIAIEYALIGDYQSARRLFEWVDQHEGLSAAGMDRWANTLEQMEQFDDAILIWKRMPTAESFRRSAILYRNQGNLVDALASVREWQARAPGDARAAYWLGLLTAADSPGEARKWIDLAASLDPAFQSAAQSFRLAQGRSELSDHIGYQHTVMGRWLGGQNAWDMAKVAFTKAVEAAPDYAEAWAFLGQARSQLNQDGGDEFKKAVEINPKSVLARALLASYYNMHREFGKAINQMEAASRLEPDRALWLVELGNYTAKNGDLPRAQRYFLQAQNLEPENPLVWEAAARFSFTYGVDLRGFGLLSARRSISLRPEEAAGYDLAGSVMMGLGDLRSAERFLHHALDIQSDYSLAHYHLGEVYLRLSEMERAEYHLKRAAELDPSGDISKAAQRLLERYFRKG